VQTDPAQIGRRLGWLQAANIFGSVLAALLVTWLFLPLLGSAGTLKLLLLLGALLGLTALMCKPLWPRRTSMIWAALCLMIFLFMPSNEKLWALVHGTTVDKLQHSEDSSGLAAIKLTEPSPDAHGNAVVFVNGIGQSWLPYGGIHSALGALPALLHPRPEHIAIIGLGSGDTAYSAAARYETETITCIEIIGGQYEVLKQHELRHPSPSLSSLFAEDSIRHIHGDGRRFLKTTRQRFDIIEADALRPSSAGSGNLYSEEYFRLVSRRLKPGGYAVTWAPTPRIRSTFLHCYPYVLDLDILLIGSPDPIQASANDLRNRLGYLEVRQYFRNADIPIHQILAPFTQLDFQQHLIGPDYDRSKLGEINTDLFPRDEFHLPALLAD